MAISLPQKRENIITLEGVSKSKIETLVIFLGDTSGL